MIFFIKHIDIEGPATLGDFFLNNGFQRHLVDLSRGECLPKDFSGIQAVVSLGGPMNVYEEDRYPFLKEENAFIKEILNRNIPFLGICLGSQLLAKARGAGITPSPFKEIGFAEVKLTEEGKKDSLFEGMDDTLEVFQWHEDTFAIPQGAKWLATAETCSHQAFKVGRRAYGLQFHIEITDESIHDWANAYFKKEDTVSQIKCKEMLNDYAQKKEKFHSQAKKIYNNLLEIIRKDKST